MRYKELGEICEIQIGKTPSRSVSEYWNGDLPWVTISDLSDSRIVIETKEKITRFGAKKSGSKLIPEGTLLLSFKLSLGKRAFAGTDLFTNEAIAALDPINSNEVCSDYLYWALGSIDYDRLVDRAAKGKTLNKAKLRILKIPLPPLEEQKRIARILDTADEIRAKRRQSIEELERLAQSVFLDMFGDPVTNPKGWEVLPIKSTNSLVQIGPFGSLLHKDDYVQNGIPLINPKHIKNDKITPDYNETINSEKFDELKKYVLEKGDVVLARRGEMGRCAIVENDSRKMICGTGSLFIRPNAIHISSVYLKHILSTRALKAELEKIAWGVTMANLNSSKVENLKLILPPIQIQQTFENIIQSIEAQKSLHQKHLTELDNLFASLQSRAFNGTL